VGTGRHFGDDAAEAGVQRLLGVDKAGQDLAIAYYCNRGLVAAGLDA
jgi:hypothetical protein